MKVVPVLEDHYGRRVWTNPTTDPIRRAESLCYNCARLRMDEPEEAQCPIALKLYRLCQAEDVALMMTRCPLWEPLPEPAPAAP